jgi:3-oxoacyl-[acyl-carrier-protein] synthase II
LRCIREGDRGRRWSNDESKYCQRGHNDRSSRALNVHSGDDNVRSVRAPVIVSGVGVVSPFGTATAAFRDALCEGRSGILPVTGFDTSDCRSTLAAEVTRFEPATWVPPMKMRRLDRTGVYALAAAKLAIADADVHLDPNGHPDIGVVLGTWTAGGQSTQIFLEALFRSGPTGAPALLFDSTVGNSAASLAGLELRLRGPNVTVSNKEASGASAIVTAVDHLREGRARALLAGGVDAVYETFFKGHDDFAVMSGQHEFSRATAPFDEKRDGFVLGEGGFILWLHRDESSGHASTYGRILGVSAASAAVPVNAWPDRHEALVRTMALALEDAGLAPGDVHVVYASANATSVLDRAEARAIAALFGAGPIVTSVKGALGESGVSGVAACIAAFVCGREGKVPPVAGLVDPVDEARPLRVARETADAPGPIVVVNSFASGGALFSLVLHIGG